MKYSNLFIYSIFDRKRKFIFNVKRRRNISFFCCPFFDPWILWHWWISAFYFRYSDSTSEHFSLFISCLFGIRETATTAARVCACAWWLFLSVFRMRRKKYVFINGHRWQIIYYLSTINLCTEWIICVCVCSMARSAVSLGWKRKRAHLRRINRARASHRKEIIRHWSVE